LGTPNAEKRRTETEKLLDWGFRTYTNYQPNLGSSVPSQLAVYEGREGTVAVAPARTVIITLPRGEENGLTVKSEMKVDYLVAPVAAGTTVGYVAVNKGDSSLLQIPIETRAAVARGGFFSVIWGRLALLFHRIGHAIKAALWDAVSWLPFFRHNA